MKAIISKLIMVPAVLLLLTISGCGDTQTAANDTSSTVAADAGGKTLYAQTLVFGANNTYIVPKSGTLTVNQSFNGFFNGALGSLTIRNADGTNLVPPVCTGSSGQIKKCLKPYEDRLALNPTSIQVLLNSQEVVAAGSIPRTQGTRNIAVAINTTNTLQVNLTGPKGSYIQLAITSENTPPLQNPTADFSFTPTSGVQPLTVNFDASASSSPNGAITNYSWDYGDGGSDGGIMNPQHVYYTAGTYAITLTVTDSTGNSATKTAQIVVSEATAPIASFTYNVDSSTGTILVNVDASASTSANGTITDYVWSWGDSSPYDVLSVPTASHFFLSPGAYSIILSIYDSAGYSASQIQTITVP